MITDGYKPYSEIKQITWQPTNREKDRWSITPPPSSNLLSRRLLASKHPSNGLKPLDTRSKAIWVTLSLLGPASVFVRIDSAMRSKRSTREVLAASTLPIAAILSVLSRGPSLIRLASHVKT